MKKMFFFAFFFSLYALFLQADTYIEGDYYVTGYDPFAEEYYTATATITRYGENYNVVWTYPDTSQETGTAIREEHHLSICYQGVDDLTDLGVEVLKIRDNFLKGVWSPLGTGLQGYETFKRIEE